MKKSFIIITVMALTGCTSYKWVKPGHSDQEMEKDLFSCRAQSLIDLPPNNEIYYSTTDGNEEKGKKDGEKNKNKSTNNYYVDSNESSRDILIQNCMMQNNYEKHPL